MEDKRFLKKLKIELPRDPAVCLLGTHAEELNCLHTHLHGSPRHSSQEAEATQGSMGG